MLKFFRRIRQHLLSENKLSKYSFYAIGEILLVVIGILIALQINNWNNERNNDKIEQQYIARLVNELKKEIKTYERLRDGFERQNQSVQNLLALWKEDNPVVKDTTKFWNEFFAGSGAGPWHKEPVIWTQLVQSGELKLIDDQEAIEALFTHYADVKSTADNYREYPTQTTNEARKLIATTFAETDFLLNPARRGRKPPSEALDAVFLNKDQYRVIFVRVAIIASIHIGSMEQLIESAQNAIELLEKNLESDD